MFRCLTTLPPSATNDTTVGDRSGYIIASS